MVAKRIIPCLDVKNGVVVKGINFEGLKEVGDAVEMGVQYAREGADELVYLDISATLEGRKTFAELVARVRAVSRRSQKLTELTHFTYHDLEVDVQLHQAKRKGQVLDLTAREFALLLLFMQSPERLITRTAILEQVWEMNFDPGTNILDVHMSHLRKKLDEGRKVKLLQTVRGIGYMLKAVEEKPDNAKKE